MTAIDINRLAALFNSKNYVALENQARTLTEQSPLSGLYWKILGIALAMQGKNAISVLQTATRLLPDDHEAHNSLGNALQEYGEYSLATESYYCALTLKPDFAVAHNNLGNALCKLTRTDKAIDYYHQAVHINPNFADAYNSLGNAMRNLARYDEAIDNYRLALAINPQYVQAHVNLGNVLRDLGQLDAAIASYHHALRINPDFAQAHSNLGNALRELGQFDDAIASCQRALAIEPNLAEAHLNLSSALGELGQLDAALQSSRHALTMVPDNAEARMNHAFLLLKTGQFEQGWQEYEYRWKTKDSVALAELPAPVWLGTTDIRGKSILLRAEQGFGDTLQFVRYATLLAARGATVYLETPPQLTSLLTSCPGVTAAFTMGNPSALPPIDYQCPMMSLPLVCQTTLPTIPATIRYLQSNPSDSERWKDKLGTETTLRVGLCWAGSPRHYMPLARAIDRQRSMLLQQLSPLLDIAGISFYSLQPGSEATTELHNSPWASQIIDHTPALHDFAQTAALIDNLDLVISVDTAVAHLAGALGKPVWLLNRFNTCWRWLMEREDSPWYPTMRIFRQSSPGDWDHVIRMIKLALEQQVL